jgi:hypothetical protein
MNVVNSCSGRPSIVIVMFNEIKEKTGCRIGDN